MDRLMRAFGLAVAAVAALLFAAGCQEGAGKVSGSGASVGKAQATCPVMGGKIDKKIFADHEGKRVYFCCDGCPETFKKDPAKYIKKLEDAGVVLEKTPAPKGG